MKVPLLDLKSQYNSIIEEIQEALKQVIKNQTFILGPVVQDLEEKIATYSGCQYGVGVSSGSDALPIALMAENIGSGDEVITTPYTFFATAGAISRVGAKPVFVDIDPVSYNIDPGLIEEKVTDNTKAIIPVHLYGQCADMDPILEIARKYNVVVIEDAAQAIGAEYPVMDSDGNTTIKRAGAMGHYGCFSFFPSKNLGAFGDGGMVVTSDAERADRLRVLRAHGSQPKYYHKVVGGNFRLDTIQAAVLLIKLKYLDHWTAARRRNAEWYDYAFARSDLSINGLLRTPAALWKNTTGEGNGGNKGKVGSPIQNYHIYNQFIITTPHRDALQSYLKAKNIGTAIYYPLPLHLQGCFAALGYQQGDFPVSEASAETTLAIPVYPELSKEQLQYVVDMVVEGLLQ
jgi:dTDP-4-amino-4,6-dideoxygalactose transaminase